MGEGEEGIDPPPHRDLWRKGGVGVGRGVGCGGGRRGVHRWEREVLEVVNTWSDMVHSDSVRASGNCLAHPPSGNGLTVLCHQKH